MVAACFAGQKQRMWATQGRAGIGESLTAWQDTVNGSALRESLSPFWQDTGRVGAKASTESLFQRVKYGNQGRSMSLVIVENTDTGGAISASSLTKHEEMERSDILSPQ